MAKIKVRLKKRGVTNVKLKPANGVKVKSSTTYLYDPTLVEGWVDLAEDWAVKTDGKVEEEGVEIDYSSKAYAIGGTGTQTNNSKYYSEQAASSASDASDSATTATTQAGIATTQAGIATTKAGEAATSETNASSYAASAASSANDSSHSAGEARNSEINAASSASTATTQAGIATTKAGEASNYADNAGASATTAETMKNNAQTWAEGNDAAVALLGGEHSSKGWAEQAKLWSDTFVFEQGVAASVWTIEHNLDKYPSVSVVDSAGNEIIAEVTYIDLNNLTITMQSAFKGRAFLN